MAWTTARRMSEKTEHRTIELGVATEPVKGLTDARHPCYDTGRTLGPSRMQDREALERRLETLRSEHRDLDDVIERISGGNAFDQLQIKRLKKRKLMLKDEIARIESKLVPDIIA